MEMRSLHRARLAIALLMLAACRIHSANDQRVAGPYAARVHVTIDGSEAEAALAVIAEHAQLNVVDTSSLQRLFGSRGYRSLVARDSTFHVPRDDAGFVRWLIGDSLAVRRDALAQEVDAMRRIDPSRVARQALDYAPPSARITATVFPVIKPQPNSFVFGPDSAPQIFLFVNIDETPTHFLKRVTHELHHIALNSACPADVDSSLPEPVHSLVQDLDAFGEGLAMLAATGSPAVDASAESDPATRRRWDANVANFANDLATIQRLIGDVVEHRITAPDSVHAIASGLYGAQGPWYTVGWKMAATVEEELGRYRLIAAMCDPRRLLMAYNEAAERRRSRTGERLAKWDPILLQRLWHIPGG
jgi:hypothetical protein